MIFKEWLKHRIIQENITGEYWITGYGVEYCDGDMGDFNHEQIVVNHVRNDIMEKLSSDYHEDWEEFVNKYCKDNKLESLKYNYIKNKVSPDEYAVAFEQGDARNFSMQRWGWKAVRKNNVETWNITPKDLQMIGRGLDEILETEGYEGDDEIEFDITSRNRRITMTLREIKAGKQDQTDTTSTAIRQNIISASNQVKNINPGQHPYYANKDLQSKLAQLGVKPHAI